MEARLTRFPLSKLRVRAGFNTLAEGARALDISRVHLANIERGRGGASEDLVSRMAKAYKVGADHIEALLIKSRKDLHKRELARFQ